jgi:mRNA interferase MazF
MIRFIKRFSEWLAVKSKLDAYDHKPPFFKEREIWWCFVGENVGAEISGKGGEFRRPVLILRKLDSFSFVGLPLTKTPRSGTWYRTIKIQDRESTVILSQIRHFDHRRMAHRMFSISKPEFISVRNKLIELISENKPPASSEAGGRG